MYIIVVEVSSPWPITEQYEVSNFYKLAKKEYFHRCTELLEIISCQPNTATITLKQNEKTIHGLILIGIEEIDKNKKTVT